MLTTALLPGFLATAAATSALPADPAAAAAAVEAAAPGGINYWALVMAASVPVKIVLLLLLIGSVVSWVIIFRKARVYRRADAEADAFEGRFWSGADLTQLYRAATDRNRVVEGLEAIFEAGFREFTRLRQKKGTDSRAQLEGAQRAMRATLARLDEAIAQVSDDIPGITADLRAGLDVIYRDLKGLNPQEFQIVYEEVKRTAKNLKLDQRGPSRMQVFVERSFGLTSNTLS